MAKRIPIETVGINVESKMYVTPERVGQLFPLVFKVSSLIAGAFRAADWRLD
jgi:hypothetical protein